MQDLIGTRGAVLAATIAAVLVAYAAMALVVARVARRSPTVRDLHGRARWPARAVALLATALLVVPPLLEDSAGVTGHALAILLVVALAWLGLRFVRVAEEASLRRFDIETPDNLRARRKRTQALVLSRVASVAIVIIAASAVLLTFEGARAVGASLLASAGVASIVAGIAARSTLGNVVAGIQIAFTEPIRIDDVVVVEGEWGRVEEITLTYVVVWIWDMRRLVLPTIYFVDTPFQNWTRHGAQVLGTVTLHLDYRAPIDEMREELKRFLDGSERWDGDAWVLQVIDTAEHTMQVRALMTAKDAPTSWDLRCDVREHLLGWLQREHPDALPRLRVEEQADSRSVALQARRRPEATEGRAMPDLDGWRTEPTRDDTPAPSGGSG